MYKELNIGEITEYLIRVKDHHKAEMTLQETDAINDACNILTKSFPREATLTSLTEDTLFHIQVPSSTVAAVLKKEGFAASEHNTDVIKDHRLAISGDLRDRLQETIVEVLFEWISEYSSKLEKRTGPETS